MIFELMMVKARGVVDFLLAIPVIELFR